MALLLPALGQVGLQLLLTPASSNAIAKGACLVVGTAYPLYSSMAVIESTNLASGKLEVHKEASQWLTYWAIFTTLTAVEQLTSWHERVPGYHHIKLMFLLWLQSSRYQGARRLYLQFLRPAFLAYRPVLDDFLANGRAFMNFIYSNYVILDHGVLTRARSEIKAANDYVHEVCAKIPFLEWFVRSPDAGGPKGRWFLLP